MKDLLAYLDAVHPGYAGAVRPFEYDFELEDAEERLGHPLPGVYSSFMWTMGGDPGPILEGYGVVSPEDIATLRQVAAPEMPPARFFLILDDRGPDGAHYWLDLERPFGRDDFEVVSFGFGPDAHTRRTRWFPGFRELLFMRAVEVIHLPRFVYRRNYSGPREPGTPAALASLERVLSRTGFTRMPQPQHCQIHTRGDAVVAVYRDLEDETVRIAASFDSEQEALRFREALAANTAFVAR